MVVLGRKEGVQDSNEELAKELADIIHHTVSLSQLSMTSTSLKPSLKKDKIAAVKYQHEKDLEQFLAEKSIWENPFERDKIKTWGI